MTATRTDDDLYRVGAPFDAVWQEPTLAYDTSWGSAATRARLGAGVVPFAVLLGVLLQDFVPAGLMTGLLVACGLLVLPGSRPRRTAAATVGFLLVLVSFEYGYYYWLEGFGPLMFFWALGLGLWFYVRERHALSYLLMLASLGATMAMTFSGLAWLFVSSYEGLVDSAGLEEVLPLGATLGVGLFLVGPTVGLAWLARAFFRGSSASVRRAELDEQAGRRGPAFAWFARASSWLLVALTFFLLSTWASVRATGNDWDASFARACTGTAEQNAWEGCMDPYSVYYRAVYGIPGPTSDPLHQVADSLLIFVPIFLLVAVVFALRHLWMPRLSTLRERRSELAAATMPQSATATAPADAPQTGGPPPGWMVDPKDASLQRWWDGQEWTDHVKKEGS